MNNFECYCEPSEGEPCEVWHATWRKARKKHICVECKEAIDLGERYEYTFIIFEGAPSSYKTCEFCTKEMIRIRRKHGMNIIPGELACALVAELRGDL